MKERIEFIGTIPSPSKMSTTRSQKRKNNQQEIKEYVSEGFIFPVVVGDPCSVDQDGESVAGPSRPKSPRVEN